MNRITLSALTVLVCFAISAGCSSQNVNLNQPDVPQFKELSAGDFADSGHSLMGIYTVQVNADTGIVDVVRNRDGETHWNVTSFLIPPACPDCFAVAVLNIDPPAKNVALKVTLKNPTNLTGYDVRGIITDFGGMQLLTADSYTKLFGPGTINPFIAWVPNQTRSFPAFQINSEEITIHNPSFPIFPAFEFVVEASWPGHCKEPYEIKPLPVNGDLNSDGSNTVKVIAVVSDWQDNIESVTLDLSVLGGPSSVVMDSGSPGLYEKEIQYVSGPGEGYYDVLITATTSDDVPVKELYNYSTVHVIGEGTEFPVEFDDEERISFTDGQSYIWPRHAVATDAQGNPHVVWADNDPDPMNPVYRLYYSKRTSGSWSSPTIIGSADSDVVYATIAIDPSNNVHVVWEDQRTGQLASDIYYASSSSGFFDEKKLSDAQPFIRHAFPRCVWGNGLLHITWHENRNDPSGTDYDVYYMTYSPGSGLIQNEMTVEESTGTWEGFPTIDIDASGGVHVVYQKFQGMMKIYHRRRSGSSFGEAHLVAGNTAYQPAIHCGNSSQDVFVTWFDYSDGTFSDVYIGISDNGGISYNTTKLSTSNTEYQINPDVVQASNGDLYAVWGEEGYIDIDGEPGPDDLNGDEQIDENDAIPHRVYFRQRMGSNWLSALVLTSPVELAAYPQVTVDVDGFVHVPYMKWTAGDPYDNYELYYRKSLPF